MEDTPQLWKTICDGVGVSPASTDNSKTIFVRGDLVGKIIGSNWTNLKSIMNETSTSIQKLEQLTDGATFTIDGSTSEAVNKAMLEILKLSTKIDKRRSTTSKADLDAELEHYKDEGKRLAAERWAQKFMERTRKECKKKAQELVDKEYGVSVRDVDTSRKNQDVPQKLVEQSLAETVRAELEEGEIPSDALCSPETSEFDPASPVDPRVLKNNSPAPHSEEYSNLNVQEQLETRDLETGTTEPAYVQSGTNLTNDLSTDVIVRSETAEHNTLQAGVLADQPNEAEEIHKPCDCKKEIAALKQKFSKKYEYLETMLFQLVEQNNTLSNEFKNYKEDTEIKIERLQKKLAGKVVLVDLERCKTRVGSLASESALIGEQVQGPSSTVTTTNTDRNRKGKSTSDSTASKAGPSSAASQPSTSTAATKNANVQCPTCDKRFAHPTGMLRHKKDIHGVKNLKCTYCLKMFARSDALKTHMKTHEKKCPVCGKIYPSANALKDHMKRRHTKLQQEKKDKIEGIGGKKGNGEGK